jgi:Carboxylesterase family
LIKREGLNYLYSIMKSFLQAAVLLLLAAYIAAGAPTAIVEGGIVVGTTTALPGATAPVNKFLGVPFAASPLRFAPPQHVRPFGRKVTTQVSAACVQQFNCT